MNYEATVTVSLKKGVLDPEAKTIQKSLERLGFDLGGLRSADQYIINLDAESQKEAHDRVEEMCERLLTNPVIHDYEISITETESVETQEEETP